MKRILPIVLLLVINATTPAMAQEKPIPSGFIEASFGFTLPQYSEGDMDYHGETKGLATAPFHFAWPFFKYVGISGRILYGTSKINTIDILMDAQMYRSDLRWRVMSGDYFHSTHMFGLYATIPFKHVDVDFELLLGRASQGIPKTTIHGYGPRGELYVLIMKGGAWVQSTAVAPSLGARLSLSKLLYLSFRAEYLSIMPLDYYTYNYIDTRHHKVTPYISWHPSSTTQTSGYRFNRFNFQVGIGVKFPHSGEIFN